MQFHSFARKAIERWRFDVRIAVRADEGIAVIVAEDEKNVRLISGSQSACPGSDQEKDDSEKPFHGKFPKMISGPREGWPIPAASRRAQARRRDCAAPADR